MSLCWRQLALQVGDEHEGKHKDRTLGGFFSALRGRSHWDTVEDLKCTWPRSILEGPELEPAPVPCTSAPVHRNTDLLHLQLTEVAIFSCSHRFPPICLLLFLSSITQCNIGEEAWELYIIISLISLTECNLAVDGNKKPDSGRGMILFKIPFHHLASFILGVVILFWTCAIPAWCGMEWNNTENLSSWTTEQGTCICMGSPVPSFCSPVAVRTNYINLFLINGKTCV